MSVNKQIILLFFRQTPVHRLPLPPLSAGQRRLCDGRENKEYEVLLLPYQKHLLYYAGRRQALIITEPFSSEYSFPSMMHFPFPFSKRKN